MVAIVSTTAPLGTFTVPGTLRQSSPLLADNIDPLTRDFASLTKGLDPVDAQVQVALGCVRDSGPSIQGVGLPPPPRKITEGSEEVMRSQVQTALRTLVRNGDIRLKTIVVNIQAGAQQVDGYVEYQNLRALDGTTRTARLPYSKLR